jgi:hypothetical protein
VALEERRVVRIGRPCFRLFGERAESDHANRWFDDEWLGDRWRRGWRRRHDRSGDEQHGWQGGNGRCSLERWNPILGRDDFSGDRWSGDE